MAAVVEAHLGMQTEAPQAVGGLLDALPESAYRVVRAGHDQDRQVLGDPVSVRQPYVLLYEGEQVAVGGDGEAERRHGIGVVPIDVPLVAAEPSVACIRIGEVLVVVGEHRPVEEGAVAAGPSGRDQERCDRLPQSHGCGRLVPGAHDHGPVDVPTITGDVPSEHIGAHAVAQNEQGDARVLLSYVDRHSMEVVD